MSHARALLRHLQDVQADSIIRACKTCSQTATVQLNSVIGLTVHNVAERWDGVHHTPFK
jgi:hypothetical protein